jgi:predicted HTH transcriptional regulator
LQNWINEVKNKTQPQIIPDVYSQIIDKDEVAVFEVQEYPMEAIRENCRKKLR